MTTPDPQQIGCGGWTPLSQHAKEKADEPLSSHDLFSEFRSMLKTAYAQKWDTETHFPWLIEIPMTHEQVAIWDKVMNPKENA